MTAGIGGSNLSFWGEGEGLAGLHTKHLLPLKRVARKLLLREDQRLGLCGERTGWFINQFLNHNALSVSPAQSIKASAG